MRPAKLVPQLMLPEKDPRDLIKLSGYSVKSVLSEQGLERLQIASELLRSSSIEASEWRIFTNFSNQVLLMEWGRIMFQMLSLIMYKSMI